MAGLDWNAPLPSSSGGGNDFKSKFPEVFGDGSKQAAPPSGTPTITTTPLNGSQPAPNVPSGSPAAEDYNKMSWGEYIPKVAANLPSTMLKKVEDTGSAIYNHPMEVASGIAQMGEGIGSKAIDATTNLLGINPILDPAKKSEREHIIDSIIEQKKNQYGKDVWKNLAQDPAEFLLDAASIAPIIGPASRVAGLGSAGAALSKVAELGDPINLAMQGTKAGVGLVASPVGKLVRYAQGAASGVPQDMLRLAEQAGRTGTPVQRSAFKAFASGVGDNREASQALLDALEERRAAVSDSYIQGKASLKNDELPLNDIYAAINAARRNVSSYGVPFKNSETLKAINRMEAEINRLRAAPKQARSAVGLDDLKRHLREMISTAPPATRKNLYPIATAVRDTVAKSDPNYATMMENWENWIAEAKDIQSTLGAGEATADTARIAKLLSTAKSTDKMALLEELASKTKAGAALPYMIAGLSVRNILPTYMRGMGLAGLSAFTGNPLHGIVGAIAASPRLAGMTSYGMGRLAGTASSAGQVGKFLKPYSAVGNNIIPDMAQDQPAPYKRGGAVKSHDMAADQLVRAAERAKKGWSDATEPLLNQSDDAVAHALEVANRSI
jgi:hypothetical protein